jgi:hypothetical protein
VERKRGKGALLALSACFLLVDAGAARAQASDEEVAEKLNREGRDLFAKADLRGAADRFQKAISLDPKPGYHFNLCFTLEKAGRLEEALDACERVFDAGPSEEQRAKTLETIARIRTEVGPGQRPAEPPPPAPPTATPPAAPLPAAEVIRPRPAPEPRRLRAGLMVGFGSAKLTGGDFFDSRDGGTAGGHVSLALGRSLGVRVETALALGGEETFGFSGPDVKLSLTYIAAPVLLELDLPIAGGFRFHALAGAGPALLVAAKRTERDFPADPVSRDVRDQLNAIDVGIASGAGVSYPLESIELTAGLRFWHGLVGLSDTDSRKNRRTSLVLGIQI